MKPIEDRDLAAVAGASTQQDLIDFLQRVQREMEQMLNQTGDPAW